MDFKKTFIDLTQWVVPHGYEETIVHLLPEGCQKDKKGNYFITIGESETLFTCHLDTVSQRAKITHVFEDNWIKTDGTTILGGDNKAGVCILMYLIEQKIPGTYFFFIGEECGRIGSKWALENDTDYFKKFKRAIAFDRRNRGSIITHQSSRLCASPDFTDALSKEFGKSGLEYKGDSGGSYTDTYTFIDVISECTNLSASVVGEHTSAEKVDIVHLEEIAIAASKVEWENLPASRDLTKKEWKSYGNYSGNYGGNSNYSYNGYNEYGYEDYHMVNLPQLPKKNLSEPGLDFTVSNVDKFFDLKKLSDSEEIYFTTMDGKRNFYFNFDYNVVAVEEDLGQKYPYIEQHYVQKMNVPKSFEELWKAIEKINLPFKPLIEQKVVPYFPNYIGEYFDLQETFDDYGNRLFIDANTHREFQFELDTKWIGVWEILSVEPYLKPIYSNDNTFKSFAELWADMREYVPFRRSGMVENTFYNGGTKIKTYNKIIDVTNDSGAIPFREVNIEKFFNLIKVKDDNKVDIEYYKSPNSEKVYFLEISPTGKVYLWEKNSGKASILNGVSFLSFDQMWTSIKGKVDFEPIEDDLDKILSQLDKKVLPLKNDNIEKYFTLTQKKKTDGNKGFYYTSENENKTSYFFKVMEDDNDVYLVDLSNEMSSGRVRLENSPHVLLNYDKFNSFDEVWNDIKDKVDFKPRLKNDNSVSKKIEFNNDSVTKVFDLVEYSRRDKHYVTKEGLRYYFDIIDNADGSKDVYLWERTPGKYKTIIDGVGYASFAELWLDIELHVKFKKRKPEIPYTQDNVTLYFDLIADMRGGGFYHKDGNNFFIHCGKSKNKVAVKKVYYKDVDHPKTGLKQISKMENLYFGNNELETFDDMWEVIKDVVPFKRR